MGLSSKVFAAIVAMHVSFLFILPLGVFADDGTTTLNSPDIPLVAPENTVSWSLINLLCFILVAILFVILFIKLFIDRRDRKYDEKLKRIPKEKALYVNYWVFLGAICIVAETSLVLFLTSEFDAPMALFDGFSISFALAVFLMLLLPMFAASFETRQNRLQEVRTQRAHALTKQAEEAEQAEDAEQAKYAEYAEQARREEQARRAEQAKSAKPAEQIKQPKREEYVEHAEYVEQLELVEHAEPEPPLIRG